MCDILKKYFYQGHDLDKAKLIEELGDVCWYIAEIATGLGEPLEEIMLANIAKLRRRYPDGFDPDRSINREE